MIYSMDDYRRIGNKYDPGADSDHCHQYERLGNTMAKLRRAMVDTEPRDSPYLPVDFAAFDARKFIEHAYSLATQI